MAPAPSAAIISIVISPLTFASSIMSETNQPGLPVTPETVESKRAPEIEEYERFAELYQREIVAAFRSAAARKLRDPCVFVALGPGQPTIEVVETLAALALLACGESATDVPNVPRGKGERLVVIWKPNRAYVFLVPDLL
jgi:hypothetical protein